MADAHEYNSISHFDDNHVKDASQHPPKGLSIITIQRTCCLISGWTESATFCSPNEKNVINGHLDR